MHDIILGDCKDIMAGMPADSVDAVVCDPPYGTGGWFRNGAGQGKDPRGSYKKEGWDDWDVSWVDQTERVCSEGRVIFFCPQVNLVPTLQSRDGWRLLMWVKSDPKPRFNQTAWGIEPIVALHSNTLNGSRDYFVASSPREGRDALASSHPHEKPVALMRWLTRLVTPPNGLVLDPFAGSGTTGIACILEGFDFIGIEKEPEYARIAKARIAHAEKHPEDYARDDADREALKRKDVGEVDAWL